ncbi:RE1 [Symbiodinium sp. CCMP2592]|nr:RE1 [Symbiodinium sp. CCMP2592]
MAVEGDGGSTAAGSAAGVSHLPWQQIPKFVPGTTNLDDYTQRLKFLKELWPADSIQHLGPRAALQVEGSAFQKISRIAPDKLRSQEGVQLIVEALGGAWGKTAVEEKFHFFEQAIFQVTQKNDETNDSYLARSDAYFEELLTRKVTIEEIRAYVLLRHSQLAPEDKKRVVIESKGDLKYKETVKAIRLLGSKIFGDLQNKNATGNRGLERNKIYDVHYTEENGAEDVYYSAVPEEEPSDEDLLCYFMDLNDEDAVYITEFEESIVDAIQDSELAPVYVTYQEARQRLRDKAKARGYWPAKGRGKTKGFGKKGKGSSSSSFPGWGTGRNRSLADRIANSTCRICHQKGHWKRECPRRLAQDGNEAKVEVTHFTQETSDTFAQNLPEILHAMPPESEPYIGEEDSQEARQIGCFEASGQDGDPRCGRAVGSYLDVEFVRPKGVETLRAWGDMTLTAGKHKTKTFAAAFDEDLVYAVTMARKQSLTSSWAISFKNYCLARLKAAARAEQMEDQKRQGKGTRKAAFPNRSQNTATLEDEEAAFPNRSRNTATFKDEEEFGEWKLCLNEGRATGSSASTAENHKGKRANAQDPNPAMNTDLTAEQRLDIMTRKALLQRELAQLEQLDPSWDEKIEDKLGKLDSETEDFRKKMHYKLPRLDVLEITLADSGISNAIRNRQGRAVSIKTWDASRIWFMIHMYEPKHLWMNGGRQDPSKVFWPKELLYDLYEHQIEHGRHFHLCTGQNIFAESSPELQDVMHGTMCAVHCPSEAMGLGKMRGNNFLNKKSFIYTTSRVVHEAIDTRKEPTHLSNPSQATSNTSAPRSPTWQLRLAEQAAAAMISDRSVPLYLSELLVADLKREGDLNLSNRAALENVQQVVKRRRLLRKQPAPEMCKARDQFKDASWIAIFKKFDVPHRGRVYFRDGDEVVKQVQTLIPQFQIKHVVMARGTNRVQLPKPGLEIQDIPLRQTIVVSRDNGKVMADGGCEQWTKPAAIHLDADFGDVLGMDVAYWSGQSGHKYMFTHILDEATLFHQATATGRTMEDQYEVLTDSWNKWAGPCQLLYVDPAGEYVGEWWRERLQRDGVCAKVAAGESHWQVGRVEAHGKILKAMLSRMDAETPITDDAEFRQCLRVAVHAKNSLSRVRGFTPEQAVFGKSSRLPASLVSDELTASHALATSSLPEGLAFRQSLLRREQARVAFVRVDNDTAYRRALLRKTRANLPTFAAGSWVLYWRQQRVGSRSRGERGRWHGPAQVIVGDERVVWLSHCGQLVRASPEHLRSASLREWEVLQQHSQGSLHNSPDRLPSRGVVDLLREGDLPTREDVEMEGVAPASEPPPVAGASPPAVGEVEGGVGEIDTGGGFEIPVDSGETPPSAVGAEQPETEVSPAVSMEQEHEEPMEVDPVEVPVPEDEDDLLFGDSECFLIHPSSEQVWEIGLHETDVDYKDLPSPEQALNFVMLASTERKKRTEVRLRDLNQHERQLFKEAQNKEIKAWLDHRTVRRVAAGTLEDSQLMRCRWILTWKAPEKEGGPHRAKARLVVLGFEDPGLSDIPNDAPTLGKDGRQLILQQVASRQWKLINFDISTAFLQGKGDGRKLGIKPPEELREALGMGPTDQCRLEGGAYGRIDAPFLWFQTLKQTLEELGFIQSPFDPCTFSLVTKGPGGEPRVHGVLGIHVDDGIGGGDAYFSRVIEQLRGIYSFGSYDEGEFVFTGIRFRQWDDGSIEMDQTAYLEKIMPIHANKVLHEAKSHAVSLMVVPIPEKHLTFCTFSDASFASSKDNHSYQGTLVIATDWRMLQNQRAVIVPVAWASKKISRVVRSTLSAEVVALCGSLDRMSWLRLFWEWIKNPGIDISHPEEVLKEAPKASLVTDCKSAYDVHQSKILADIRLNSDRGGRAEVRLSCQKEQGSAEGATI